MDTADFRVRGKEVIDYVCDLNDNVDGKPVRPDVEPGFLARDIPKDPPKNGENFDDILKDLDEKIIPGVTKWVHPGFHAYFPTGRGYPSLIADMITGGLGCVASSWASSPACTELETIMLDWLGKAMGIPPHFIYSSPGSTGGGVIQSSTSDCLLACMIAARTAAINYLKENYPQESDDDDSVYLSKLVAYTSKEAHVAVQRSANIAMVKLRLLDTDDQCGLRGPTLADQIHSDQGRGLHPFFVSCTLGTAGTCGFDNLKEIGPIVKKLPQCWLHVDSSYAGCGFICPELRHFKEGMEFADSFNVNCSKWLTVTHDCSGLWVKDRRKLEASLVTDPILLKREQPIDYRLWGLQLTRRFRALKLWLTFRIFGVEGLQAHIRNHCRLAKEFESHVLRDGRFVVTNEVRMGLVCFRLIGSDEMNQDLLASINKEGKIYMIPARVEDRFALRFCVTHPNASQAQIDSAWSIIQKHASDLLDRGERSLVTLEERSKYSFVEMVPRDLYEKWRSHTLTDGAGPFYVSYEPKSNENSKKSSDDPGEVFHDVTATF